MGFWVNLIRTVVRKNKHTHTPKRVNKICGRPRGRPHRKEYHKKVKFSLRIEPSVLKEFRDFCENKGVSISEVITLYMRTVLIKKDFDKARIKILNYQAKTQS